jgi:hypothetical protein
VAKYVTPPGNMSEEEFCDMLVQISFIVAKNKPQNALVALKVVLAGLELKYGVKLRPKTLTEVERIIKSRMH